MTLIVNGVCRYALNGTYFDRPWTNILDFFIDTTGSVLDRNQEIFDQAGNLINSWVEHIPPIVSDQLQLRDVTWVDLDSANGSTGQRVSTSEHSLPISGDLAGPGNAGNGAVLVTKTTASSRGQRNGRLYQAGFLEQAATGNDLAPGTVTTFQNAFDDFLAEINDSPIPGFSDRYLVVVHTTQDSPNVGTSSRVLDLVVDSRLATQRRRLRG